MRYYAHVSSPWQYRRPVRVVDPRNVNPTALQTYEKQQVVGHESSHKDPAVEMSILANNAKWMRMNSAYVVLRLRSGLGGIPGLDVLAIPRICER
jgi:hypothetical protein